MKIYWNRLTRKWMGEHETGSTESFDRAFVRVHHLEVTKGSRPECEQTGWIGSFVGTLINLGDRQIEQGTVDRIQVVRFDGKFFEDDQRNYMDVSQSGLYLLLPTGLAVKLS